MSELEYKKCDNCNRMLSNGDMVTVIISDVEVSGRYRKGHEGFRLKLSADAIDSRCSKIYCKNCLDVGKHTIKEENNES